MMEGRHMFELLEKLNVVKQPIHKHLIFLDHIEQQLSEPEEAKINICYRNAIYTKHFRYRIFRQFLSDYRQYYLMAIQWIQTM